MSRFIERKSDGTINEEVVSMQYCKWLINDICCNSESDCLADYPYPMSICEIDKASYIEWNDYYNKALKEKTVETYFEK